MLNTPCPPSVIFESIISSYIKLFAKLNKSQLIPHVDTMISLFIYLIKKYDTIAARIEILICKFIEIGKNKNKNKTNKNHINEIYLYIFCIFFLFL
jgi:hypothetical protein